ncbi:MAG: vWA domain-containing protein [Acidimicrobiia bacterium]
MAEAPASAIGEALVPAFAGFARELRVGGMPVGTGQIVAFCRALTHADLADIDDVYWAGRACLVSRHDDVVVYDAVFERYFRPGERTVPVITTVTGELPDELVRAELPLATFGTGVEREPRRDTSGGVASDIEVLRSKDFSDCDADELAAIARLLADLEVTTPRRRTRRTRPARRGARPDLHRALRNQMRRPDDALPRDWRRRRTRPRDLVLLLDVSGSMAAYSRALLQFAFAVQRGPSRVEVFCFGTRLTRVSSALAQRDPDVALARAAESVLDWDGGTRIGESIQEYLHTWARRARCRGAIVVICSDGLERGDPEELGNAMARLARLSHRILWVNPLNTGPEYQPITRGMVAALPNVDVLLPGHNLASLVTLAEVLESLD